MNRRIAVLLATVLGTANPALADGIFNGGSGGGGSGTVTSISAGCGSSTGGSPITTTGTIAAQEPVDLETGSNFAITNADCGYLVDLSNASAQTPTIAQAGTGGNFSSGWYADVCNIGAGAQTLTPTTSTINGASTWVIFQNQCGRLVSDGTNYQFASGAGGFGTSVFNAGITVKVRSSAASTVTASATTDYFFCLDPTSNTIGLALPASPATGLSYLVKDCTGKAATNSITITPNSGNIDGSATFVMSTNYQSIAITYTGSQWSIN